MSVIVSCQCGQQFATQERHIGKSVACPMCGRSLTIGAAPPPAPAPPKLVTIRAVCACGRSFLAPAALQGMTMTCPGCHDVVVVPPPDSPDIADLTSPLTPALADPLALPPAHNDSTEKLAFRLAYIAAGSVGLLAVAIILTSLFQSIARVWTTPVTIPDAPAQAAAPAAGEKKKSFPSLPSFLPDDFVPFSRTPKAPPDASPALPKGAPPPPPAAESLADSAAARANLPGDSAAGNPSFDEKNPGGDSSQRSLSRLATAGLSWHAQPSAALRGVRRVNSTDSPVMGFSWLTELLPFLDQQPLFARFNFAQSVTSQGNLQVGAVLVPEFINPLDDKQRWQGYPLDGLALTHFAGISGVEDARNVVAAKLPRSDPRAGVFGYDEVARPKDITDGVSQTIMLAGTGALANPWVLGGGGTVRGAREPLFDKTSGLGTRGLAGGGTLVVMADGSVRQVTAQVDPRVFKALCTIHGADSVDVERAAPLAADQRRQFRWGTAKSPRVHPDSTRR